MVMESVEGLSWVPVSVWHIILSVVASLLVHRYMTIHLRSPFLLWQVVGITSLYGWALTAFLIVSMGCIMRRRSEFFRAFSELRRGVAYWQICCNCICLQCLLWFSNECLVSTIRRAI